MLAMRELYQEVIIDHNKNPRNFYKLADCTHQAEGFNPLCGDKILLYLKIENNKIVAVSFEGVGCAISTASASLMTEILKNKTIEEAETLFSTFHALLTDDAAGVDAREIGKLCVLAGVKDYPARVKCATLAWHALQAALGTCHPTASQRCHPAASQRCHPAAKTAGSSVFLDLKDAGSRGCSLPRKASIRGAG